MYGLIARFYLLHDRVEDFDRVARETVAAVQEKEPGTLVYAVHEIEGSPLTRLYYEVYRDRRAFEEHEAYDHAKRFQVAREECSARPPDVDFLKPLTAAGLPVAT